MNIKRSILISSLMLSVGMASVASANPISDQSQNNDKKHYHMRMHQDNKLLTKEQKGALRQEMRQVRQLITPIIKEKRALRLQLMGKIATNGVQWQDISGIVNQINEKDAQINTIFAKTQLKMFQKYGVLLPPPHKRHHFKGHRGR